MVTIHVGNPPDLKRVMRYLYGQPNYSRLARDLGIGRVTLYRWENGEQQPRARNLARIQELVDRRVVA